MAKKSELTDQIFIKIHLEKKELKKVKKKDKTIKKKQAYVTFDQIETLFERFLEEEQELAVQKLELVMKDEKGRIVSSREVFVQHFQLDEDYENLLKVFAECLLNDSRYSSWSFEEKQTYLLTGLFPAYQISRDCGSDQLPLLPDREEEEFMDCPVPFFETSKEGDEENKGQDAKEHNRFEKEHYSDDPYTAPFEEEVEGTSYDQPPEAAASHAEEEYKPRSHIAPDAHYQTLNTTEETYPSRPRELSLSGLTFFETKGVRELEASHVGFVEAELDKVRAGFNQELKAMDQDLQGEQEELLTQKRAQLELEKHMQLQTLLEAEDDRSQLKTRLLLDTQEKLNRSLARLREEKQEAKTMELERLRVLYERQVASVKATFKRALEDESLELQERVLQDGEATYRAAYLERTEALLKLQEAQNHRLDLENEKTLGILSKQMTRMIQAKDKALHHLYENELTGLRQELEERHHNALRDKQELEKRETLRAVQDEMNQLKENTRALQELQQNMQEEIKKKEAHTPDAPRAPESPLEVLTQAQSLLEGVQAKALETKVPPNKGSGGLLLSVLGLNLFVLAFAGSFCLFNLL
ncbi:hypothetical protein VNN41_09960 [Lactococcus garvieae]|uniref:hypothetical protein n=1 Tax=Lactococcus garvieae TaxID=1363 RepID=UPI00324364FC